VVIYLTKEDVVYINQRTISAHGGNYNPPKNFLHESNLDFLVETVYSEIFGEHLYPKISDKAAVYCFNIISNYIFTDGNKRTGLEAALSFLKFNGHRIDKNLVHTLLTDFILKVASGQSSLDECRNWFQKNIVKF
jgi:death on curing protein